MFFFSCLDIDMDDIKETIKQTVVVAVGDAMKKKIPEVLKLFEDNLDSILALSMLFRIPFCGNFLLLLNAFSAGRLYAFQS